MNDDVGFGDFFYFVLFVFDNQYIVYLDWLGQCNLQVGNQVVEYWLGCQVGDDVGDIC